MVTLRRWTETPITPGAATVVPLCAADVSRTVLMVSGTINNNSIAFSTQGNLSNTQNAGTYGTNFGGWQGMTLTWDMHRELVRQQWFLYLALGVAGVACIVWEVFEWESSRPQTSGGILLPPNWDEQYAVGDDSQSRASYLDALVRRGKGVIDRALQIDSAGRAVAAE